MSRTDVHRPWFVQAADPYNRHLLYRIPGNLPQWPEYAVVSYRNIGCGCSMCTGQYGRRFARRRERAQLRAHLRSALKTHPTDREEIDIPPPRRGSAW